jgi:selenocysteine lyase/cysteine desulfurase
MRLLERTRASVLDYLRASSDDYVAIFTPNATGAL